MEILDFDWLKDIRKCSNPMISRKMMTKIFEKSYVSKTMAALNQERFTLATDDMIEELQSGVKNMWRTWCEGRSIALEIEEHEPTELNRLLEKFYAEVKSKDDLPALPPRKFFHVHVINK